MKTWTCDCCLNQGVRTSLVLPWLRFNTPNAEVLGSIPGEETRCHMLQLRVPMPQLKLPHTVTRGSCIPQLKILHATIKTQNSQTNKNNGASLVAQWLKKKKIHLPMQETWDQSLGWEDSTCHGVTKPMHHNYWACVLESRSCDCWAHASPLLKPELHRACAP